MNVVIPDPIAFFWKAESVADAAAVKSRGIKTLLANDLSTYFIKCKPVFRNGPKCLPKNPPDCRILCNWVFGNFKLANELLANALRSLETCLLVENYAENFTHH